MTTQIAQELLSALEEIMTETDGRNPSHVGQDRAFSIARAAIIKAKGWGEHDVKEFFARLLPKN